MTQISLTHTRPSSADNASKERLFTTTIITFVPPGFVFCYYSEVELLQGDTPTFQTWLSQVLKSQWKMMSFVSFKILTTGESLDILS